MRFTRAAILTACLPGLLGLGVCAEESVALKHALAAGDVSHYKRTVTTELTPDMPGGSEEQVTVYYRQSVTKAEDGKLYITLDYKGAETRAQMMMGANPFDELAGKSFDLVIAQNGKEIKPIDFSQKIPGGLRYMSVCAIADCILKEIHFPDTEVSPGDTWQYDLTQDRPNLGEGVEVVNTGGTATFKFDRMENAAGRKCAVVSFEYDAASTLTIPQADMQPWLDAKVKLSGDRTDKGKGEISFDPTEGRLVKYSYDGVADMTMKVENVPDEAKGRVPQSMKQAEKIRTLVELIDQQTYDSALQRTGKPPQEGGGDEAPEPPAD